MTTRATLPHRRAATTCEVKHGQQFVTVTVGHYADGSLSEVFVTAPRSEVEHWKRSRAMRRSCSASPCNSGYRSTPCATPSPANRTDHHRASSAPCSISSGNGGWNSNEQAWIVAEWLSGRSQVEIGDELGVSLKCSCSAIKAFLDQWADVNVMQQKLYNDGRKAVARVALKKYFKSPGNQSAQKPTIAENHEIEFGT